MKRTAIIDGNAGDFGVRDGFGQKTSQRPRAPPPAAAGKLTAAPAGKRPPQAKTQPEFDAYKAAAHYRSGGAGEGSGRLCDEVSRQRVAARTLQAGDALLPTGEQCATR